MGLGPNVSSVLILVRHAEAVKNVVGIHGGRGSVLTDDGRAEARQLACELDRFQPFQLMHIARPQAAETASILGESLNAGDSATFDFEPFNLGIISEMSDAEVRSRHPSLASQMSLYRSGRLEMCDLFIPDGDTADSFFFRAVVALQNLKRDGHSKCLVGTRSVLVGLSNAIVGRHPRRGGGYREIPWMNGGYCVFSLDTGTILERKGVFNI